MDDDHDTVELLAEVLRGEGFDVVPTEHPSAALRALESGRFDLVLSDQCMPSQSGSVMLAEARRRGLLEGTGVLVVTATPDDPELDGWKVLRKPVDFDLLIEEAHHAILRTRPAAPASAPPDARRLTPTPPSPAVTLVLYVTAQSLASRRAHRTIERLLSHYDADGVSLSVVDLAAPGATVDPDDRVAFTPTLVKRLPAPRVWLVGDLRNPDALRALLDDAGLPRKHP